MPRGGAVTLTDVREAYARDHLWAVRATRALQTSNGSSLSIARTPDCLISW